MQAERETAPTRAPVLIAGAGNWLLTHDRIGTQVLTHLQQLSPAVEIVEIGTSSLALLDVIAGQELLIIVDACIGLGTPGEVIVTEPHRLPSSARGISAHQISPIQTLAIARRLFPELLPQRILLVLVETSGDWQHTDETRQRVLEIIGEEIHPWCPVAVNTERAGGRERRE